MTGLPALRSRRRFLEECGSTLGAGWVALNLPLLASLSACARDAAEAGEPFRTLGRQEGRTLVALADRILPSDDGSPGATEAGAAWFVDNVVAGPMAGLRDAVAGAARDLDERAGGGAGAFADLDAGARDRIVAEAEADGADWFEPVRMLVILGTFSDPAWGGNRGGVGWDLLALERAPGYQPPFGFYDAEALPEPAAGEGGTAGTAGAGHHTGIRRAEP